MILIKMAYCTNLLMTQSSIKRSINIKDMITQSQQTRVLWHTSWENLLLKIAGMDIFSTCRIHILATFNHVATNLVVELSKHLSSHVIPVTHIHIYFNAVSPAELIFISNRLHSVFVVCIHSDLSASI